MDISDLNGRWRLTIASNIHDFVPDFHDLGDAELLVVDGRVAGSDVGGVTFSGELTLAPLGSNHDVDAKVVVDPRTAGDPRFVVAHYDGNLRREPVTHATGLKVHRSGGGDITSFTGEIQIGAFEVTFTGKKI